jgi:hypothetical protein
MLRTLQAVSFKPNFNEEIKITDLRRTLAFLATLATIWGTTYMYDRAHRYDIVAAGAGSGGTQDTVGNAEIQAFIIDHQTGKVWISGSSAFLGVPLMRLHCRAEQINSMLGCSESAAQESEKK